MTRSILVLILAAVAGASLAAAWRSHVELVRLVDTIDDARAGNRECRDSLTRAQARLEQLDELLGLAHERRKGIGGP